MSSFPTNYTTNSNPTGIDYFPGIMGMQFGTLGFSPYQSSIATVAQIALVNSSTATIFNSAQAELGHVLQKPNIPEEYSYTTDITKLKDRMVLKLYSPNSNNNSLSNYGTDFTTGAVDMLFKGAAAVVGSKGGQLVGNSGADLAGLLTGALGGDGKAVTNTIKNFTGGAAAAINDLGKSLSSSGRIDKDGLFENLDEDFYNSGTDANKLKYKIIYLPMPMQQIIDSHAHQIGEIGLNPLTPTYSLITSVISEIFGGGGGKSITGNKKGFEADSSVIDFAANTLKLKSRKAINPTVETLYGRPNAREWQYTFEYVPTNKKESDNFIEIISLLKQHSYPTVDAGDTMYNFPGTCQFYFEINNKRVYSGENNEGLPSSLKPCFIRDIQVSYINGTGNYTHFRDGTPTSINLTMTLVETQLLNRQDLAGIDVVKDRPYTINGNSFSGLNSAGEDILRT